MGDFCEAGEGWAGEDFEIGKFPLGPIMGAQYTYADISGFTETEPTASNPQAA